MVNNYPSERDQLDKSAKIAEVRTAEATREMAKASQEAASGARETAKWTLWVAIAMFTTVFVDVIFRIVELVRNSPVACP